MLALPAPKQNFLHTNYGSTTFLPTTGQDQNDLHKDNTVQAQPAEAFIQKELS